MTLPDRFIDHDSHQRQIAAAGLAARDIVHAAVNAMGGAMARRGAPPIGAVGS
jgi:hypothetical protein